MSTDTDNRTPESIERDIARTREQMSATIDQLQSKMSPGQLLDQGLDYLRSSGAGDFGSNLGRSVRDNPLPVALVGVGLAWLMASGRSAAASSPRATQHTGDGADDDGLLHRAGAALDGAKDSVRDTAQRVADRTRGAKQRVGELTQHSKQRVQEARDTAVDLFERHPLVLGGLGLALGSALAGLLPTTRTEDELMGDTRDDLLDKAKRSAQAATDAAREPAGDETHEPPPLASGGTATRTPDNGRAPPA